MRRNNLLTFGILHVHRHRRRVRHISQSALLWCYIVRPHHLIHHFRRPNRDVFIPQVKIRVRVARDFVVRFRRDNLLNLLIDQIVERFDVLPNYIKRRRIVRV